VDPIAHTLADFGQTIGVPQLQLGPHNTVQLDFDSGETFTIEPCGDEVLLHVAAPLAYATGDTLLAALKRIDALDASGFALQLGYRKTEHGDLMIVATRVPVRDFTPSRLEAALQYLRQWAESVRR
jgi:type III secretion system chaperone SycN